MTCRKRSSLKTDGRSIKPVRPWPVYTLREAAACLGMDARILAEWYKHGILRPAERYGKGHPLLSFANLEEAYKLYLMTIKVGGDPLNHIRKYTLSVSDILAGDMTAYLKSISSEVLGIWKNRIVPGQCIYPWKFAKTDDASHPVALYRNIMSGALLVTGTRIRVADIMSRIINGESYESVAKAYNLNPEIVRKAFMHAC